MSAKDVIIALDFPTREETLSFLDQFPAGEKPFVKIGMSCSMPRAPRWSGTSRPGATRSSWT